MPQMIRNKITEPRNHIPDIAVGLASIPAPIAVPAMIIDPPKSEGSFFCFIFCLFMVLLLTICYLFPVKMGIIPVCMPICIAIFRIPIIIIK